jgi:hypothetical protein
MGKIAVFFRSKPGALAADGGDNTGTGWTTDAHQTGGRGGYRRVSGGVAGFDDRATVLKHLEQKLMDKV